jgi:hypothetical protein
MDAHELHPRLPEETQPPWLLRVARMGPVHDNFPLGMVHGNRSACDLAKLLSGVSTVFFFFLKKKGRE